MGRRLMCAAILMLAAGPAFGQRPASIRPDAVKKAKQATAYLRVTDGKGRTSEGSGFLAVESGVVVTNAHVLGMLSPTSKAPKKIEVVLHSGQANEIQTTGTLLGVDRAADLAVLRIEGAKLPDALQLGVKDELFETQKVYIFGFPFGAELGKNITVSESSISSLRLSAGGALTSIQVNGGMHPGNSGGPVVNSLGEVIGVSVAGIRSTQINFAIPAASVQALLAGGIQESKAGEVFRAGDDVRVPVTFKTLDPFKRIREIRVEVWAGKPAASRMFSMAKADTQPGDGPRKSHVLKDGSGDVPLPKLTGGQIAWLQPVLVDDKGKETWGAPQSFDAALAIERTGAELLVKLAEQKERTVHLKTVQSINLARGKTKFIAGDSAEVDILEVFDAHEQGARVRTAFGAPKLVAEEAGRKSNAAPQVASMLLRIPPAFIVDETNRLRSRVDVNLGPSTPIVVREQVADYYSQICNGYEACNFIIPNKKLQARDTWDVRLPLLLKLRGKGEVVDLVLVCTYEGSRQRDGNAEAVVRIAGQVRGRNGTTAKAEGQVEGKFTFDVKRRFVSSVQMKIFNDTSDDDVQALYSFDIDLTRREGNPLKLEIPKQTTPPPNPSGGDVLVQLSGTLKPSDPMETIKARNSNVQYVPVQMTAGKSYVITLDSSAFDAYLRLKDPAGKIVAEDDDSGGGLNSRIQYVARMTGKHTIAVASFDGKMGRFELKVTGDKAVAANDKSRPSGEDMGGQFAKPIKSKAPTSYLNVVSPPGDYIGQGKTFDYAGEQLNMKKTPRGIRVAVDGWNLDLSAPKGEFLKVGEYRGAKRNAFAGDSPGLDFSGKGRGSNRLAGEFIVHELEFDGDRIVRVAIDFVQRSEERGTGLRGKLRFNSTFE